MVHRLLSQKFWHELFEAGVFLKALNSIWETCAGVFLLLNTHSMMRWNPFLFIREEFLGGRGDMLFRMTSQHLNSLSVSTKNFIGLYLLLHGLLNMFLAYNLYKNRLWAYPAAMAVVSLFLIYQIYRLLHTHSLILLGVTIFDIAFVILTWHEYRIQHPRARNHVISSS
ncbi:MAG TPA: DUF2127 domain-containing protein [Candidatus Paceibacterota bacterium]|nr:DUF2127 domain-containing protein [Candidatus Paceibacterota bacterium]